MLVQMMLCYQDLNMQVSKYLLQAMVVLWVFFCTFEVLTIRFGDVKHFYI